MKLSIAYEELSRPRIVFPAKANTKRGLDNSSYSANPNPIIVLYNYKFNKRLYNNILRNKFGQVSNGSYNCNMSPVLFTSMVETGITGQENQKCD